MGTSQPELEGAEWTPDQLSQGKWCQDRTCLQRKTFTSDLHLRDTDRATNPKTGGRPTQELAGDQPENWRATNPRTGGIPTQELVVRLQDVNTSAVCASAI